MSDSKPYRDLIEHWKKLSAVRTSASLLEWDQQTHMPPGGAAYRGEQMATLASIAHEMTIDTRVGEWLAECEADIDLISDAGSDSAANLREIRRAYDHATKLPAELVNEMARAQSAAFVAWEKAKGANDYAIFKPHLQTMIDLNRRQAECFGWSDDGEPWDALADLYEAGMTAKMVEGVFTPLREQLVPLIDRLLSTGKDVRGTFDDVAIPRDAQMRFVRMVSDRLGFDYQRGRIDLAPHPFCSGTHCHDVRLTTRFQDTVLTDGLGSTMHESGHGMYEQNLPADKIGTPAGHAVGLSIHESQSRLWENHVGRSLAFWRWAQPKLSEYFGDAFANHTAEDGYASCNAVQRSLIRVEADEVTYHMHIMIRFELERLMLAGELSAEDVPEAWNARYREYLGIDVPSDARGCMQDVHWSYGSMGYFPTYTLGSLYAAQFFATAQNELGDTDAMFAAGNFAPLKDWLTEKIYSVGHLYDSETLCERVTGSKLSAEPFMQHIRGKLLPLYGLN